MKMLWLTLPEVDAAAQSFEEMFEARIFNL
jgi:hypothetical protein